MYLYNFVLQELLHVYIQGSDDDAVIYISNTTRRPDALGNAATGWNVAYAERLTRENEKNMDQTY